MNSNGQESISQSGAVSFVLEIWRKNIRLLVQQQRQETKAKHQGESLETLGGFGGSRIFGSHNNISTHTPTIIRDPSLIFSTSNQGSAVKSENPNLRSVSLEFGCHILT